MAIHDIYSKRNRNQIDVFSYDNLTDKIKVQIIFIWRDFFKEIDEDFSKDIWNAIQTKTINENLDVIEIVFRLIEKTPEIFENNHRNFRSLYTPDWHETLNKSYM